MLRIVEEAYSEEGTVRVRVQFDAYTYRYWIPATTLYVVQRGRASYGRSEGWAFNRILRAARALRKARMRAEGTYVDGVRGTVAVGDRVTVRGTGVAGVVETIDEGREWAQVRRDGDEFLVEFHTSELGLA